MRSGAGSPGARALQRLPRKAPGAIGSATRAQEVRGFPPRSGALPRADAEARSNREAAGRAGCQPEVALQEGRVCAVETSRPDEAPARACGSGRELLAVPLRSGCIGRDIRKDPALSPLSTPSGTNLATLRAKPALWTTSTTRSTSL